MSEPERHPLLDVFDGFEPGGNADEFVRACTTASIALATILQGDMGWSDPLSDRLNRLEHQLKALNENLRSFIKVLDSIPRDSE